MPSAAAKVENKGPLEAQDPLKHVLTMIEKKSRNLEKRKSKLDHLKVELDNGKELNEDQKTAVKKYDQVVEVLEFTKELHKAINGIMQEHVKMLKKTAKREQLERQQQELQRVREILLIQDLLDSMGSEEVRADFTSGTNGAIKLSEETLVQLDELYKLVSPERPENGDEPDFEEQLNSAAEHMIALLDGKNKEVLGTTYKALHDTLKEIQHCGYFSTKEECVPDVQTQEIVNQEHYWEQENEKYQIQAVEVPPNQQEELAPEAEMSEDRRRETSPNAATMHGAQTRPIQDVLAVQGNLNFLQESQIDVECKLLYRSEASGTMNY